LMAKVELCFLPEFSYFRRNLSLNFLLKIFLLAGALLQDAGLL